MKKLIQLMVPVALVVFTLSSCDKDTPDPEPTTPTTPTTPTGPTPPTPKIAGNYWGLMAAIKMDFSYSNPQLPQPISVVSDIAVATFYSGAGNTGSLEDAGTVSVNSNNLEKQSNNSYTITATTGLTPATLDLGTDVKWDVSGGSNVTSLSYNHKGSFPSYSGTLPTTIDKSQNLELNISSDVMGADSVYVVIATSSKTIIKSYNSAVAKATIDASELASLPDVSDNTAYIEVVPFTYAIATLNSKDYVFIKETAAVGAVEIK